MEQPIRKIISGRDPKNGFAFVVGQSVYGGGTIHAIAVDQVALDGFQTELVNAIAQHFVPQEALVSMHIHQPVRARNRPQDCCIVAGMPSSRDGRCDAT